MSDTWLLFLLLFIGIGIGFVLGLMAGGLRPQGKDSAKAKKPSSGRASIDEALAQIEPPAPAAAPRRAQAAEVAQPAAAPIPPATPPGVLPAAPVEPLAPVQAPGFSEPKTSPPAMNPVDVLARAFQSDVKPPKPAVLSIAAQVDEVLQELVPETPYAQRGLRLVELPGQGIQVRVGLEHYDGIDAVPDPEIRRLIRQAVAEWERRTEAD